MPFFILICLGIIVVLLLNLWRAIFGEDPSEAAYLHVAEGQVEMKSWGTDDYFSLAGDSLIVRGDEIRTSSNAKVIVEFFDGTLMRIGGSTDVVFEEMLLNDGSPIIEVKLDDGALWFNRVYKDTENTSLTVAMDDVEVVADKAGVFALENRFDEVIRVFKVFKKSEGALVNVLAADGETVLESEEVAVAQEVVFSPKVIEIYRDHKSPTVHEGIDNDFRDGPWYQWNVEEDKSPTEFEKVGGTDTVGLLKVEPEVLVDPDFEADLEGEESGEDGEEDADADSEDVDEEVSPEETTEEEDLEVEEPEEEEAVVVSGDLAVPTISTVSGGSQVDADGFYRVKGKVATLFGEVSGATKLVVNDYTLSKFNPGDTTWTYFANADFGLMKEGENTYEVYAVGPDGAHSESLIFKVFYEPEVVTPEVIVEEVPEATAAEPTD